MNNGNLSHYFLKKTYQMYHIKVTRIAKNVAQYITVNKDDLHRKDLPWKNFLLQFNNKLLIN